MKLHILAAALAIGSPAASPALHWYTEDTKYRMCTTVDHAYDFLGTPKTPEELANALGRLGTPYDIIRNDNGVAILQAQITKLPIPLFKSESECTETLKRVLEKRGVTYGSPFLSRARSTDQ